jgi:hypothetical protein
MRGQQDARFHLGKAAAEPDLPACIATGPRAGDGLAIGEERVRVGEAMTLSAWCRASYPLGGRSASLAAKARARRSYALQSGAITARTSDAQPVRG